jgi:hypothetical protein
MTLTDTAKAIVGLSHELGTATSQRLVPSKRAERRRVREEAEDQQTEAFLAAIGSIKLRGRDSQLADSTVASKPAATPTVEYVYPAAKA